MTNEAVAIIPARGGSKRVPRKNIKYLHGQPLIAYTIDAAINSGLFSRVIVSTDCAETADIAQKAGAEIPFMRQPDLADDFTPVSEATLDTLLKIDPGGEKYSSVCQLMANCPLRDAKDLSASYDQFTSTQSPAQISVVRYGWQNPWWAFKLESDQKLAPLFAKELKMRSQDLPELFCPTGAIWWARSEILRENATFHVADRTGCEIDWKHGLDIDTLDDWEMADILMTLEKNKKTS